MPQRSSRKKEPRDVNELAFDVVRSLTSEEPIEKPAEEKNPHAVALGRLGGLKGGKARAEKLSAKKRKEIARKAAISRWGDRR
jgi:hypothetical protein